MTDKITIERETLERAIADYDSAAGNDGTLLSWNRARDNLLALLRAALAAQPAPAAVPPGYALVPIEPTPEMIDAGLGKLLYVASPQPRHIYRAMIAAAGDNT